MGMDEPSIGAGVFCILAYFRILFGKGLGGWDSWDSWDGWDSWDSWDQQINRQL